MPRTSNLAIPGGLKPLNALESDLISKTVVSNNTDAIYPGDAVILATDGSVQRAAAGEGIYGTCIEIQQYKDSAGVVRQNARYLPAATTWTAHHQRSIIRVLPATWPGRYRVKTDAAVASLTVARALSGANIDLEYSGADTALGLSGLRGVIGGAGAGSAQLRIVDFVDMPYNDPTVGAFEIEVVINEPQGWPVLGASTTGI
jgi:hypothetical protein